jgi:transcriptional regulator with PAS, ATPase and Fis domain
MQFEWADQFDAAITVCDTAGIILYMNEQAASVFIKDGGKDLVGKSLLDCHPEAAASKLLALLENHQTNTYTIEKNGIRKMIYQAPWYIKGTFAGMVEISFRLPQEVPHFVRK